MNVKPYFTVKLRKWTGLQQLTTYVGLGLFVHNARDCQFTRPRDCQFTKRRRRTDTIWGLDSPSCPHHFTAPLSS